jgi:signal peptidase II
MYPAVLGLVLVVLDQWTKWLIRSHLELGDRISVIPGLFNITYVRNTGAAWGIFQGQNLILALVSLVMLILLVVFRKHLFPVNRLAMTAYGCLIGGILGNFYDRVKLNYVVDFLDFYIKDSHFPSFNIADSAICIGVALYMTCSFIEHKRQVSQSGNNPSPVT